MTAPVADWSAQPYLVFEADRTRPVRDLLAACPHPHATRAADLGCGPGNSTEVLAAHCPRATITGVDSAPDMIAAARRRLPRVRFELADVVTWRPPERLDLILSNAALQWVPDHATLLPQLLGLLAPAGILAVQIPDNLAEPAQTLMHDVAAHGPWAARLASAEAARTPPGDPAWYYGVLKPHCARVEVWRTTYHHVLTGGADDVVAWFESTGLRPFLAPLDAHERADYLRRYRDLVARSYAVQCDGSMLLAMPRLFVVATV